MIFDASSGRFARLVSYPRRDSDRNPKGGDGTAPSRSDESAGRNGIAPTEAVHD